ncbi:GNAT family N-acetyltransferase [Endozoicomonas arenosclerae]|uniref:GNAT family N-acetyltransferase n=1 Tax=Endozoicomonas arenosclerae TaxID=1633495 RepID=UPI00078054D1|nr:hypothetical protein [Endozoicomonas arenosclerae]
MNLKIVDDGNREVYLNLCQGYEAEFSSLTGKKPDPQGRFALDTPLTENTTGYLLYDEHLPAGLAAVKQHHATHHEVCEFYVLPCYRRQELGKRFAHRLFSMSCGQWEIKQIEGADNATTFWRKTISDFLKEYVDQSDNNIDTHFQEDIYVDPYWGKVTRQVFTSMGR